MKKAYPRLASLQVQHISAWPWPSGAAINNMSKRYTISVYMSHVSAATLLRLTVPFNHKTILPSYVSKHTHTKMHCRKRHIGTCDYLRLHLTNNECNKIHNTIKKEKDEWKSILCHFFFFRCMFWALYAPYNFCPLCWYNVRNKSLLLRMGDTNTKTVSICKTANPCSKLFMQTKLKIK